MTDKDVLTQEEIDALLSGVEEGDVVVDAPEDERNVTDYDLTNQDRVVRGRLPALEMVAERFIRRIRSTLPSYLKLPIEVGSGGVQVVKYSEYIETLYVPTCVRLLKIEPFAGTCMMTLEAKLIHRLVDRFFGGAGDVKNFEGKEFTPTEHKVVNRLTNLLLSDFESSWEDTLAVKCSVTGEEINPAMLNLMSPSDAVLVTSFRLDIAESSGELQIAFPYAALEPFKQIFDANNKQDDNSGDAEWRAAFERALMDAEVPLNCLIGEAEVRLRTLLRMQTGDELDLDMGELHQVSVGRLPLFTATLGDSRGKLALEFNEFGQG